MPTQSFATVTVTADSTNITDNFISQNTGQSIVFQGHALGQSRSAVPEPGAIALISGAVSIGALALRRKYKTKRKA